MRKIKAHHFHEFGIYMYVHGLYNALDGLIVVKTFGTDLCHTKIFLAYPAGGFSLGIPGGSAGAANVGVHSASRRVACIPMHAMKR